MNIEALLIVSGQNVKRLLTFEGSKPKKLAQAAALRPPVATGHEISRTREHRSSRSWRPTKAFFNALTSLALRGQSRSSGVFLRQRRPPNPKIHWLVGDLTPVFRQRPPVGIVERMWEEEREGMHGDSNREKGHGWRNNGRAFPKL